MMLGSSENKRRMIDRAKKFSTRIGGGCTVEGHLRQGEHCTVGGHVIGDCDLNGILRIEKSGFWKGNIIADVVVIGGTIEGTVSAYSKIELGETGKVVGNIKAPAIAIAEGGTIDGEITMMGKGETVRFKERREEKKEEDDDT
jgi:cytoskeletal protein CcmA (bactofilin family)